MTSFKFTPVLGIVLISCILFTHAFPNDSNQKKETKLLSVGEFCGKPAAPVGPDGSWQTVESNVEKICPEGTSCRKGACNCDDLADGTVMSHSYNAETEKRECKRIAGQKCAKSDECVGGASCTGGICVCDKTGEDVICPDTKHDLVILN